VSDTEKKVSDTFSARLRWRCRRGMRELDRLLTDFLAAGYPGLSESEKQRFADLLELPDPELHAYLLGRREPEDAELAGLLETIRACGVAGD
jgi:antitoxin CptB